MSDELPRRRTLESLKKEAKRWLDALAPRSADARTRLRLVLPKPIATPTLRDVQHALAREQGFPGWRTSSAASSQGRLEGQVALHRYDEMADALLQAYRTGTPAAMERHWSLTWHRRAWQGMRTYVQLDLGRQADATLEDETSRSTMRATSLRANTALKAGMRSCGTAAPAALRRHRRRFASSQPTPTGR